MKKDNFAARVRAALARGEGHPVRLVDLERALQVKNFKGRTRLLRVLARLGAAGEVIEAEPGRYRLVPRLSRREAVWRALRAQRVVTAAELAALAECSQSYAERILRGLVNRGAVVRQGRGRYRLLGDRLESPPPAPEVCAPPDRRRQALLALNRAWAAIADASDLLRAEEGQIIKYKGQKGDKLTAAAPPEKPAKIAVKSRAAGDNVSWDELKWS